MDLYQSILDISKTLLSQTDADETARILLHRAIEIIQAQRGFIVVREKGSFEEKFDVHYDRSSASRQERKFSRSLVRLAIDRAEIIESKNLLEDDRFLGADSVQGLGPCAVLVVPLRYEHEIWGVLYMERQGKQSEFSLEARRFVADFAELAGLCLRSAQEKEAIKKRNSSLEHSLQKRFNFPGIITEHPSLLKQLEIVGQVADTTAPVLITGASGTGKELIAKALHCNSSRSSKPLVTLNCGALPAGLLESELFGHLKGSFSGATKDRVGRIASADSGTLFLDEIGELPPDSQVKLLRVLQSGEIQRVGSDKIEKVNVRVVAATLQDLPSLIKAKRFREDLFFRLNVIQIHLPALKDRSSDIPLLLQHFTREYWPRPDRLPQWTPAAVQTLQSHDWPGNIRELESVVRRACLLASGSSLGVELLPAEFQPVLHPKPVFATLSNEELKQAKEHAEDAVEQQFLQALMERHQSNISQAARESGISRRQLQKFLAKHRLKAIDLGEAD